MSDELHKYPGNLKHHKVDAPKREPLLSDEAMDDMRWLSEDGKPPRERVRDFYEDARAKDAEEIAKWKGIVKGVHGALSDIGTVPVPAMDADLYDAVMSIRAKDAELIQRLVDAIEPADCHHPYCQWVTNRQLDCDCHMAALSIAAAAGYKPTQAE